MRRPYRSKWSGSRLDDLRAAYEDANETLWVVALAFGLSRTQLQRLAVRHGWTNPRRAGGRPQGHRVCLTPPVCRVDGRAISLRKIMLQAVEGRAAL